MNGLAEKNCCSGTDLANEHRSESYASSNEHLQQRMQQLASDHQSQLYDVAKNTELLENEVKLLTLAKDHQYDGFKAQVASLEEL